MSRNDFNLGPQMRAFAEKIKVSLDDVHRGVVVQLFSRVIRDTPVGLPSLWKRPAPKGYVGGQARGSWVPSNNYIEDGTLRRIDASGAGPLNGIVALNMKAGDITYLTNGVPYLDRLEYERWSTQALSGFIRINIARIEGIIAEQIREASP